MGIGIGNWALLGDDTSNFTGGTIDNLTVTGSGINTTYLSANSAYIDSLSAGTYYSGSTPLWSLITSYMTPPTTGLTFDSIGMAVSDETTAITSGSTKLSFRMPYDFQLTGITAYLTTTGSTSTIVDVNSGNTTSLLSSAITIGSGSYYTVATNLVTSTTALTEHQLITVDIDSAGSGAKGLKLWLEGYRVQTALGSSNTGNGGPSTGVVNGINTFTGGTFQNPSINITAATLSYLSASSISASTYYSGTTDLATALSLTLPYISSWASAPIGTIMAWHKSLSGTPSLPDGWLECNGQVVTDTSSPYYGKTLPNLNNDIYYSKNMPTGNPITGYTTGGYFLRGTSGTTGIIQEDKISTRALNFTSSAGGSGGAKSFISMTDGGSNVGTSTNIFRDGSDAGSANSETRPHNFSVCWIIKIKLTTNSSINLTGQSAFSSATIGILSANTIYSSTTDLYNIFSTIGHTHPISDIINLSGSLNTKANLSGATFTGDISAITIYTPALSANTYYSGNTTFETILGRYAASAHTHPISDIINLSGSLNTKANLSGATFTGNVSIPTLTASTYISGSTNLYTIFARPELVVNNINAGTNIQTGGTATNPTISTVASPAFINGSFSGSLSAGTFVSGTTDLNTYFNNIFLRLPTKANLSGATFTGNVQVPILTATTYFSGATTFQDILGRYALSSHTHTISDIINLQGSLDSKANLSGANFTSLSGTAIFSGSNNLNSIFAPRTVTVPYEFIVACSDETTAITTGTSKVIFLSPCSWNLTGVTASLSTTGSSLTTINVKKNGTTIFSTKLTIDANEENSTTAASAAVITGGTWAKYDKIAIDIDGAGSSAKGLKLLFEGTKTISI